MQKVDGAGGRLGDHIDGVTRPETGIPREGLDPVVLLGSEGETIYSEAAQERTEDAQAYMARCRRRSKSVGGRRPAPCVTFVVAGPPKYGSPTAWKPEKVRAWAADSVKWLVDRSGRGSTLAHCALHQDEGAPHLHATFVVANVQGRLGWNRIRERFGLTGKERGPQLMSAMQDRYHRDVAAKHGLERPVRRDPDDEGVDEALAAGGGRFLRHPADGLVVDPEPDLLAVRIEPGPEPEGPPVRFLDGVVRRQGPGSAGPVLAPALDDDRQLAGGHGLQSLPIMVIIEPLAKLLGLAAWRSPRFSF